MERRLLVVEDEPAILFALKMYFSHEGFVVDTAQGSEDADALLDRRRYAVVIADLRLGVSGGTEGLEVVASVRRRCASSKIILLTAYGTSEVEQEARRRGADAFLHKPLPLATIANVVSSLLERA